MLNTLRKVTLLIFACYFSFGLQAQKQLEFLYENELTFDQKVIKAEAFFDTQGRGKGTGYKQFIRWKYSAQQELDNNGYVLSEEHKMEEYQKFVNKNNTTNNKMMSTWVEKGPLSATNTSTWSSHIGRLSNIAIDPTNEMHLVVTSLGGGVWKTTDEGTTWTPLFDQETTMSLQSAMISHANSNHYFIGGSGIWRSTDAGATFGKLTGPAGTIYSIVQDPTDEDIILASSSNGRVYKTTDGGDTWTSVLVQSSRQFYDLDFKPGSSDILYTCGRNGAFYITTDQGDTWTSVAGPWNSTRSIMFAVTPDDANYIYVLQEQNGGFGGLYLSTDGGTTWTTQSDDSANNNNIMGYNLSQKGGQAPRDMDVIVSPTDKTEVHVAGVMTFRSYDSGVNWTQTTSWLLSSSLAFVHADIDQMIYKNGKVYVASDGGIFISQDSAQTFTDKTTGLGIRQFYRISASTTEVARVAGGSQDNGTGILRNGIWYDFMGADGMEPLVLNSDDDVVIGSIQFGQLQKSVNGGNSTTGIVQTQNGENGEWVTPLERDPIAANTIYQGKKQLYKSVNAGGGWTTISDFGSLGNMDEICIAPQDNNTIYVSFGSTLQKTSDGGITWNQINQGSVGGYVNYIQIDPNNTEHVILAVSNNNRFIETTDGGANWASIRHNLPNITSRSVVFDNTAANGIYVSLSKGVYFKDDNSPTTWTLMDTGLPKVDARELEVVNDKLYLATYGRGLWEMDIPGAGYTFSANSELLECLSNNTQDSLDDLFTFQIDPTGMGLGTTYSISGDFIQANVPYGTPFVLDNNGDGFLKHDGGIELTLTDDANASIVKTITVNAELKENCFNNLVCDEAFVLEKSGIFYATGPSRSEGASTAGRNANWFYFIPKADGRISVNSCGMGKDTNIEIHKGSCDNLTSLGENDDSCTMGPGLSNYASQLNNIAVESGQLYYIEWDNKWSSDPFEFEFLFEEECNDYLIYDVNGTDEDYISAATQIRLDGTLSGYLEANSPGEILSEGITLDGTAVLKVTDEACAQNTYFDAQMENGVNMLIPDNGMLEIPFEFPSVITQTVSNFRIGVDIRHTDISQLVISIVKPDGTAIPFWEETCAGEENLNFIVDYLAINRDLCGDFWQSGYPAIAAGMLSAAEISSINGTAIAGEWKIRIEDTAAGEIGNTNHVFLFFKGE